MKNLVNMEDVTSYIAEDDGICNLLVVLYMQGILERKETVSMKDEMIRYLISVDKYSFNKVYPLVHSSMSSSAAYQVHSLWDRYTDYGKLRYEVLEHLIQFINKERGLLDASN